MRPFLAYIKKKPLTLLLLAFLLAIMAEWQQWGMIYVFIFSALGVVPMAGYIGEATEVLAVYTGPKIGGLLNATLGNAAELIITLIAIKAGLLELVKASITGSILGYVLGLVYSLKAARSPITVNPEKIEPAAPHWSLTKAIVVLALATLGVVIASELLVGAVEVVVAQFGISEFFLGIILIPIVGNVAEHLVAVTVAYRNHMELSVEIAVSSSLQIALFVAPLLVFISLAMGNPLTLVFNIYELIALTASILITALVAMDGESNWLEGAALLAVYLILGISFFLLPAAG